MKRPIKESAELIYKYLKENGYTKWYMRKVLEMVETMTDEIYE